MTLTTEHVHYYDCLLAHPTQLRDVYLLWRLLRDSYGYYTNQRNARAGMMEQSLAAQRAMPLPPTTEAMIAHLEAYHPVAIPPTAAYVWSYLDKYRDKVIVVKTKGEYAQLVARFANAPP